MTDPEVKKILESIRSFHEDQELTKQQADAIELASKRPPSTIKVKKLPSKKEKQDEE